MSELWARLSRFGFAGFFLGLLMFAIGISQGIAPLWQIGLAIPALVILVVIGRAARDAYWPKQTASAPQTTSRSSARTSEPVIADRAEDI